MFTKSRIFLICIALFFSCHTSSMAAPVYTSVGEATNNTTPSEWLGFSFDISKLVAGATEALLKFDLRNDGPFPKYTAGTTTAGVSFGTENSNFFVKLNYLRGGNTNHYRNVQLLIDGKLYVDQFGASNNHLGHSAYGTAWQGGWGIGNILGQTGLDSTTFAMSPASTVSDVPVPAALWLFGTGLIGLFGMRKKSLVTTTVAA